MGGRLGRRPLFEYWRSLQSQKHKLIWLSSLAPLSLPCFPTFGFPSCKEALGSGLSHCPLPGPPHLPFTVPSPTVFPGPVSCPDSTRLAQLHVVGQSAPTFPPHAVLLHTSCSLLPKPSFAVGWMMGAPLHHLSLETPTTQADGLSSSHPLSPSH